MLFYESCKLAVKSCLETKTFAIARLYSDDKTMGIHIHDCYEIYFSIAGGKQFLIDNRVYEFGQGIYFLLTNMKVTTYHRLMKQHMSELVCQSIQNI